jgi:hypothetical protein
VSSIDSTHQGDIRMMANGSNQVSSAPRNVTLLVLGCSSCALAVTGMLATGTEMLGLVSTVGLGTIISVTRLARRMKNAWQQRQRPRDAAGRQRDADQPLLAMDILPGGGSANSSLNAA